MIHDSKSILPIAKRLLKDSSIYSLQPILGNLISFLLIPVYTIYLTTRDYGNLQYIMAFGQLFLTITGLSLESSFWKFKSSKGGYTQGEVILNVLLTQLFIGIAILMLSLVIKFLLIQKSMLADCIILYLFSRVVSVFYSNILLVLRANFRAKFYVIITSIQSLSFLMLNIYLVAFLKLNYQGIIYSHVIIMSLFSICFYYILSKEFNGNFRWNLSKEMVRYGFPIALGNIAAFVISFSDRFFLKAYCDTAELGMYSFGYKFADLTRIFVIMPFFLSWNPIRWDIYEMENGKDIFANVNKLFFILLPALGLIVVSGAIFLGSLVTVNKEYLTGFRIIVLIAFSHVLYGLYYFNAMGMLFENKTKIIMYIAFASSLTNLLFNFLFVPHFGMLGAAVATLISYLTMFILGRYYSQQYYPIERRNSVEAIQLCLMLCYVTFLTVLLYNIENLYWMAFLVFIIALLYGVTSLLSSKSLFRESREILRKFIVRI